MDDATKYLESFANMNITHSRTIKTHDYSWDGAYIVMADAIWNRLQMHALPTPGPSKSMITAGMVLTLSWTMLFEIVANVRSTDSSTTEIYDCGWDDV